ncbi:MAG TPA: hypothetical protein VH500_04960 [Nitrososphaeraceae archaeon]|jgi:hypothetical protein
MVQPPGSPAQSDRRKVVVDIAVTPGRRIIAFKPIDQLVLIDPVSARKMLTSNSIPRDRINNRIRGRLIGKSLENAIDLVNKYCGVSKPGEYGSLYVDPLEFIEEN